MCPTPLEGKPSERVACAGAVVTDADGRLLLIQRANDPARGRWSVPGGRVEPGETSEAAAAREVREETGLHVSVGRLLLRVTIGDYEIEDFAATVVGGELVAGDDAADARWCTAAQVNALASSGALTDGLIDELTRAGVFG
jgi:ADP-ribose pyrophosphatase YjhB (NUDIX family)